MNEPMVPSVSGRTADLAWIRALYEFGHIAAHGADPLRVRQDILNHIVQGFDAESGSIALIVDGTEDQLEIAAGTDLPPGVVGSKLQRGVGVFGHVVATRQPLLINGKAAEAGLPVGAGAHQQPHAARPASATLR